jgi:hypothetical protein
MAFVDSLNKAALVVAHPDDEILWFSSIVDKVGLILVCFLDVPSRRDWSEGRQRAARAFPLPNTVFLGLTESETFNGANWSAPVVTDYGLEVAQGESTLPGFSGKTYRDNYELLKNELGVRLQGYTSVFTHNPWGEYGHEEHVQVHRAVSSVRQSLGFNIYFSNYCSTRSYHLMLQYVSGFTSDYDTLKTNANLATQVEQLYRRNNCWTWPFDDYTWFTHECFMKDNGQSDRSDSAGHVFPLNFIKLESSRRRQSHSPLSRLARVIVGGLKANRGRPE